MAARICVLTPAEARLLELRAVIPDCSNGRHLHCPRSQAATLVKDLEARWVGQMERRIVLRKQRTWRRRQSGGVPVQQWVTIVGGHDV